MKMNSVVRKIIADKFASAIKREALTKTKAAACLGFTLDYVSKLSNELYRNKLSDQVMERFQAWSNSGLRLREYAEKVKGLSTAVKEVGEITDALIGTANHGQDSEKERLLLAGESETHRPEVDNTTKPPKKEKARGAELQGRHASHIIVDDLNPVKPEDSIWSQLKDGSVIPSTPRETVSIDRLTVILQVINELKEMGFDVDIHISPKQ